MSKMFNYEADQIHEMVHPDLLTDTTHYVAECKDIILNEVTPNYPKLTEYEKEWFYFANNIYQDGQPVNLEYQTVTVDGYASVENAIPFYYKHAILKGQTLVNVIHGYWGRGVTLTNDLKMDSVTTMSQQNVAWSAMNFRIKLNKYKQNTDYIAMWDDIVGDDVPYKMVKAFDESNVALTNQIGLQYQVTTYGGKNFIVFNTGDCKTDINVRIHFTSSTVSDKQYTLTVKNMKIFEYQDGMENWDIPYFKGMQSVKMPALKATGKNLFDVNSIVTDMNMMSVERVKDGVRLKANESQVYRCAYSSGFKVERGKYYNITYTVENENPNNVANVTLKNINGDYFSGFGDCTITGSGTVSRTFLAEKSGYVRPQLYASMGTDNGAYYVTYTNVMISEVSSSKDGNVEYEPYQSNILHTPEEVVLCSLPNGVTDTLNLNTGEYVQRIEEVTLNGSETEWYPTNQVGWESTPTTVAFGLIFTPQAKPYNASKISSVICDKFMTITSNGTWGAGGRDVAGVSINQDRRFDIRIERTKLSSEDLNGFKQWLSQNPITVCYELETPIIKTVNLNTIIRPYEGTNHFETSSNTIPPLCELSVPVESTGAKTLMEISQED